MTPGEIEFDEDGLVTTLVTIGEDERDAVIRVEEFVREYFADNTFIANEKATVFLGNIDGQQIYKVVGW